MSPRTILLAAALLTMSSLGILPPAHAQAPPLPDSVAPSGEPVAEEPHEDEAERANLVAPDGIPYDNEESYEVMQMKALSKNLLRNGSFEEGRYWPYGWEATNELATFIISGGTDGYRCLRVYTDLLETQWQAHDEATRAAVARAAAATGGKPQALNRDPRPPAPARIPTNPPYYDTVAGLEGVHYRSEYIRLKPRAIYRFCVDARTDAESAPRVFIKGFFDQKMRTRNGLQVVRRNAYRAPMILDPCDGQWRRYARTFHPSKSKSTLDKQPLKTEYLQVQLYAYWKPGNYYFDNCRLEIVGYEEEEEPQAEPAPAPPQKPEPAVPDLGEDEFPVFDP